MNFTQEIRKRILSSPAPRLCGLPNYSGAVIDLTEVSQQQSRLRNTGCMIIAKSRQYELTCSHTLYNEVTPCLTFHVERF